MPQHRSEIALLLTTLNRSPGDLDISLYCSQQNREFAFFQLRQRTAEVMLSS
jgi:hypothetical protein